MGGPSMATGQSEAERLQALHTQRRQLEQEITETEKIIALEAQKESLSRDRAPTPESQLQPVAGIHD